MKKYSFKLPSLLPQFRPLRFRSIVPNFRKSSNSSATLRDSRQVFRTFASIFQRSTSKPKKRKLLLIATCTILILGPTIFLLAKSANKTAAAWWDDTWAYRQTVPITNSGSTTTNQYVKVTLDTATLISADKLQSNCDDLRITNNKGKLLSHFIDGDSEYDCNDSDTTIYVMVDSLPASGNNLYLYYGNSNASNVEPRLGTNEHPAISCRNILEHKSDSNGDGQYFITPSGNLTDKIEVTCDMTTDSGGWIKVYEGLCTSATSTSRTTGNVVEISSDHLTFDQMRIAAKNWDYSVTRTTTETALMQLTFSGYYQWLHAEPSTPNPDIKFYSAADGIQDVQFTSLGEMMMGYGNSWRRILSRFYTQPVDEYMYLGGLSGTGINYDNWGYGTYNQHMNDTSPAESGLGLTPRQFQEIYVWVREDNITLISNQSAATPTNEERSEAPAAYWKFDEGFGTTTNNSVNNTSNGSFVGSTVSWQTEDKCISGKCLYFDGNTGYLNEGNNSSLSPTDEVTVSMWVKNQRTTGKNTFLVRNTVGGGGYGLYLNASSQISFFQYWASGSPPYQFCTASNYTLPLNEWVQITGQFKKDNYLKVFINGVQKGSCSPLYSGPMGPNTSNFLIGYQGWWGGGTDAPFLGYIDEVKLYPYARTAAQIKTDYKSRGTTKGTSVQMGASNKNLDSLSNGLLGYWKMDETSWNGTSEEVIDSSGNGNNGTSNCGGTCTKPTTGTGKYGNGGVFDGVDDYVGISYPNPTTATSVVAWFKRSGSPAGGYHIITGGANIEISINESGGYIRTGVTTTTQGRQVFNSGSGLVDGNWHQVAMTYDGINLVSFIDGTQTASNPVSGSLSGTATEIGRYLSNSYAANGKIDEVRIYNRALSGKEVRDLYNWAPGPVGYWNFDEKTGITANDKSGNGNTGTLTNSPTWNQGKYGGGIKFTTADKYIDVPTITPNITNDSLTIEGWINVSLGGVQRIFTERSQSYPQIGVTGTTLFVHTKTTSGTDTNLPYTTLPSNCQSGWHHLAITWDASLSSNNVKAYCDGINFTSATLVNAINGTFSFSGFRIGHNTGTQSINGSVDDIKIYNYARTSGQIIEDMNAGHPIGGSPIGSQISYWKLDENQGTLAHDSVGSNNGTLTTSPSWSTSGKFSNAVSFNGNSGYINVGDPADGSLDFDATQSFSVTYWIKTTSDASWQLPIWKGGSSLGAQGYDFEIHSAGHINYNHSDTVIYKSVTSSPKTINDNNWHHIAGVTDRSTNKMYLFIDGIKQTSGTDISTLGSLASTNTFRIRHASYNINGLIDEVKVYGAALTEDQVKLDMNQGASMVLGSTSTTSAGAPDNSSTGQYCVPGSSDSCSAPIAEWKLDEKTGTTIYDASGNGHNSTSFNGTPSWTTGKIGAALDFEDTENDWVVIPDSNDLDMATNDFTACLWINPETTGSQYDSPLDHREDGGTNLGYQFRWGASNEMQFLTDYGASSVQSVGTALTTGTWYYLCAVVDRDGLQYFYQNGQLVDSDSIAAYSGIDITHADNFIIGSTGSTTYDFDGKIDQVRIYNYARTPAQIAWDYNRGAPVGHWKLDECQGITANDSSGNGNSGTITIGATGTNTSAGTCTGSAGEAWKDGATGKYNSSLEFDGTDDIVSILHSSSLDMTTNSFTLSAWQKTSASSSQNIMDKGGTSASSAGWRLQNRSGGVIWVAASGGDTVNRPACSIGSGYNNGTWHLVTAIFNRSTDFINVYVDGSYVGNCDISSISGQSLSNSGSSLQLSYSSQQFNGQIDDIRVYNYALTPTQVKTLMNEGSALRFGP